MTRDEVIAKMIEYAAMAFKADPSKLSADTDIAKELGVASTQRVAMSASIENDFDVMIPVARFGNYKTIGDLADYVISEM
ncbi:MAG: acyl carrier protein [Clostridiales bacterium]|nr:acyl carrier protein [Clostridiales bacterium]MCD8153479.1 acyl carrier protein [Clostridiales bacterium]